ncbi:CAF17-like 4Fe-4S cluster assembly/insertion protein YgfZ [Lonepinella sp. BR2930]|uniref:CAF17-like 4Fe-4S cluster assembly/insertion protein YgfZ n=1 Tax=Lonepinella sp. BR2930 TaxID=3434554 RepID=UPI003F6DCF98
MAIISLQQYRLIEIVGVDAEKYLQGQLTCDVTKLAVGESTMTAHCDPKGKMTSVFRLIRVANDQFYTVIHHSLLPVGLDQLKKYAVFSKVTFTELHLPLVGLIDEESAFSAQISVKFANRCILINPESAVQFNADSTQWDLADIQQGYPILTHKTQGEFIPQALNLQVIEQAISFQKGCYIGQETVARAKYRGTNKRVMFAFNAETDLTPELGSSIEMQLESGWRATGTILSAVNFSHVLWLQVVLSNDITPEQVFRLPNSEVRLVLQALPYELN